MGEKKSAPQEQGAERWKICKAVLRINRIPVKSLGIPEAGHSRQKTELSFLQATLYLAKSFEANQGAFLTGAEQRVQQTLLLHSVRDLKR